MPGFLILRICPARAWYSQNIVKLLILHAYFGVADGARTHDNRNHNLDQQPNSHAACSLIGEKLFPLLSRKFSGFAALRSHI